MKAVVQDRYGEPEQVLRVTDLPPPEPGENEVLVRVCATSVHADVWHAVTGQPAILRLMGSGAIRPRQRIPGTDVSGKVVAVGRTVTRFRAGDAVFGATQHANLWKNGGAFADTVAAPQNGLALKPNTVSHAQAVAVVTPGLIALNNLQPPCAIQEGWNVLVNGAAGALGSTLVQLAKVKGARVTAVDFPAKHAFLNQLGADDVQAPGYEHQPPPGERFDLIVDVASTLSFSDVTPLLTPQGKYVFIGHDHYGRLGRRWLGTLPSYFALAVRGAFSPHLPPLIHPEVEPRMAMEELRRRLEIRQLTPVIDRTYPLAEAAAALSHLASGTACGRIVLVP
jgi:NADPH:quinone reductase-like Zn-dependent oxidoreductase